MTENTAPQNPPMPDIFSTAPEGNGPNGETVPTAAPPFSYPAGASPRPDQGLNDFRGQGPQEGDSNFYDNTIAPAPFDYAAVTDRGTFNGGDKSFDGTGSKAADRPPFQADQASPWFDLPAPLNDVNAQAPSTVSAGPQDIVNYGGTFDETGGFAQRTDNGDVRGGSEFTTPAMDEAAAGTIIGRIV